MGVTGADRRSADRFLEVARPVSGRCGIVRRREMKQAQTTLRPVIRGVLLVLTCTVGTVNSGCDEKGPKTEPAGGGGVDRELTRVGGYAFGGGVLYREVGDSQIALLALPGADAARDTLPLQVGSEPALGPAHFRAARPAPDSEWLAWEVGGPGTWVGVLGPEGQRFVLDSWSNALVDTLMWAPAGGYLAVILRHPDGRRSVEVYEVESGRRLGLPWKEDCIAERCDLTDVGWLGGTLLDVEIRPGIDEPSVPFEVNVTDLSPASESEEATEDA